MSEAAKDFLSYGLFGAVVFFFFALVFLGGGGDGGGRVG